MQKGFSNVMNAGSSLSGAMLIANCVMKPITAVICNCIFVA